MMKKSESGIQNVKHSQFSRPKEIGIDHRSEFKAEFLDLCANMIDIKQDPMTPGSYNLTPFLLIFLLFIVSFPP